MARIQCDVCDKIISTAKCPHCGFDNSYQLHESSLAEEMIAYIEEYEFIDRDKLEDTVYETFGIPYKEVIQIISDTIHD